MNADRATLHAAVLKAMGRYMLRVPMSHQGVIADAIVAAVIAVDEEGVTVEWGARCISQHCHHHSDESVFQVSDNRSNVEWYIDQPGPGEFQLVRRTRRDWSEWEAVNADG